jgi:hypothetical protein
MSQTIHDMTKASVDAATKTMRNVIRKAGRPKRGYWCEAGIARFGARSKITNA